MSVIPVIQISGIKMFVNEVRLIAIELSLPVAAKTIIFTIVGCKVVRSILNTSV